MDIEYVRSRFIKHFDGTTGAVYASPGRINLIGEHTDYNGGFVFPGAIDKGMIAEIKPNGTNTVKAYSIDLKDYVEFGLNEEDAPRRQLGKIYFRRMREMIKTRCRSKRIQYRFCRRCASGCRNVLFRSLGKHLCLCVERSVRRQ